MRLIALPILSSISIALRASCVQSDEEYFKLSSITELPMRVAARSELHAKVSRQDRVVLHEFAGECGRFAPGIRQWRRELKYRGLFGLPIPIENSDG
jgi:hypothetical protein